MKKEKPLKKRDVGGHREELARERILHAAMTAFMERGYAEASTLEIATRARVSKRELYALFGNKEAMLAACIANRSQRMRLPAEVPAARDRKMLAATLARFGAILLREICQPAVIGVFRLAIAEAGRSPEVARTLDTFGREASRAALRNVLTQAQSAGLLRVVDPAPMAAQFLALLWGDLMMSLLLRLRDAPTTREIDQRAKSAADAFLQLHPAPARGS
jgi:AcrR family transcriptional regulator